MRNNISFIVPAYNCADTLEESINSIFQDNLTEGDEVIIINDASTDGTADLIEELKEKYPAVSSITHKYNKGSAAASRNTGIENAKHELIFCLDSDNILVSGSVPKLKRFMIEGGFEAAAFAEKHFFENSTHNIVNVWKYKGPVTTLEIALSTKFWPGPSGNYLYTKNSWRKAGRYHESVGGGVDSWAFGIRQLASGTNIAIMPDSFYFHRHGIDSAFVRDEKAGNISLKAVQVLLPLIPLIDDVDVEYILSYKGRYRWYYDLDKRPLKLRANTHQRSLISRALRKLKRVKNHI